MGWASQVNTFLGGAQKVVNDTTALKNSYNDLRNGISSATLGLVKLPKVPLQLNRMLRVGDNVTNILNILGLTNSSVAGEAAHTQTSSGDANTGSFKWVEMETTPENFATADSVLLFAGESLYSNLNTGAELVPIGLCQNWQFSSSINVTTFKELRCEENIVIPGKSQAGSMTMGRLCGTYSSLTNRLHILPNWNYSTQSLTMKPLFGIMAMFLTPSREQSISTLYFERCAITSVSMGLNAGSYQILDNVGIVYGRCIGVGELTVGTTETVPAQDSVQSSSSGNGLDKAISSAVKDVSTAGVKSSLSTGDALDRGLNDYINSSNTSSSSSGLNFNNDNLWKL